MGRGNSGDDVDEVGSADVSVVSTVVCVSAAFAAGRMLVLLHSPAHRATPVWEMSDEAPSTRRCRRWPLLVVVGRL